MIQSECYKPYMMNEKCQERKLATEETRKTVVTPTIDKLSSRINSILFELHATRLEIAKLRGDNISLIEQINAISKRLQEKI